MQVGLSLKLKLCTFFAAIVDYMKKQVGLASKEVKSLKELKNRMLKEDVTVVGFFNSKDDQSYSLYQDAGMGM